MTTQPASVEENRLHFSAIQSSVEFMALTERQQVWVLKYLADGMTTGRYDAAAATMAAYNPKDMKTAAVMGWQMLNRRHVKKVLDLHFKISPMGSLLIALEKAIHKSLRRDGTPTVATQRAIEFYERAMRKLQPKQSEKIDGVQRFVIGQRFKQNSQLFEVKAVEAE